MTTLTESLRELRTRGGAITPWEAVREQVLAVIEAAEAAVADEVHPFAARTLIDALEALGRAARQA